MTNIILITKCLNLNWKSVKSFIFLPKMISNMNFQNYYFSYVGYYQSPTIPTIHNCFRQKSVYLSLPIFLPVVTAVWAGQNFKWSKINLIVADSCIAIIHSRA